VPLLHSSRSEAKLGEDNLETDSPLPVELFDVSLAVDDLLGPDGPLLNGQGILLGFVLLLIVNFDWSWEFMAYVSAAVRDADEYEG
jgi:hypothetical protein